MLLTLIITLVVALVVIAIIVSAIQQHKERLATLKRAEYSKLRTILEDTEELIVNSEIGVVEVVLMAHIIVLYLQHFLWLKLLEI